MGEILTPEGEVYDPKLRQDHSGMRFRPAARNKGVWERMIRDLMLNPRQIFCPECQGDKYIIIADDHPTSSLMALRCYKCGAGVPPMEMHKPQMQDATAKQLGLWLPDTVGTRPLLLDEDV